MLFGLVEQNIVVQSWMKGDCQFWFWFVFLFFHFFPFFVYAYSFLKFFHKSILFEWIF